MGKSGSLRALIFDLDGTLVDSLDDISSALNTALHAMGRPAAPRESVRRWVGDGLPTLCRRAWSDADEPALAQLINRAAEAYREGCLAKTRPYDKILELLELLKRDGIATAVLSNKPHALTVQVVDGLGLRSYFRDVRGYQHEELKKPNPTIALEMAREMGNTPELIGIVGDSVADIRTARNAGMRSVAVTWGFQEKNLLEAEQPDHLVDAPLLIRELTCEK